MLNAFVKYFSQLNKLTPSISPIGMGSGMLPSDDPDKPTGATYKTQAEVDAANTFAKDFSKRGNYVNPGDAYVAKKPGDPVVQFRPLDGKPFVPNQMPASMIKNSVPDWVDKLEWDHGWNMPYYKDGNDMVFVNKQFYNSPRFVKKTK